jgi:tRNA uridine 5-carbamoylmethylation protein Kti12
MKHLKKYNESIQIDEFKEYVKDCFIEFKDDSKYNFNRNPIMTSDTSIISDNDNYLVELK